MSAGAVATGQGVSLCIAVRLQALLAFVWVIAYGVKDYRILVLRIDIF